MITIEEIFNLDGLKQMEDNWGYLLKESGVDNIFLSFDWILTWWRCFSRGNSLFVLKIMDKDQLIGIAPLMIRRHTFFGLPVRTIYFIGTVVSDRMDFILTGPKKKESILAVLNYIMKNSSRWDFVDLQEMSDTTGNFHILRECIKELNLPAMSGIDERSFYIAFRNIDKGKFLKTFSKNIQRQFKNVKNRVSKEMDSEFEFKRFVNTNGNGISPEELVSEIERIEKASWKGKACSGLFSEASTKFFHNEIIKGYFKKGLVDISFLSIKGRNIAYQYNYSYNARLYNYSVAYDTKYSRFSPGLVLQIHVLESCCDSIIDEFDFLREEAEYKNRLTSDYKIHARTRIFNGAVYSKFLFILQSCILPYLKNKKIIYKTWMGLKKAAHVFKKRY
ncbi:MAG TPA: hypothetical protein DCY56_00770 [Candidatus Omnitrophica bacterium]|nr:hypothetical protein [Candidatus Omnitrophota bacterium]